MRPRTTIQLVALAAVLVSLLAFGLGGPAQALEVPYATGPGSYLAGFTEPVLAVPAGSTVSFTNGDIAGHNVVSIAVGSDSQFWCIEQQYEPGRCPLFWSPVVGIGQQTPVYGIELIEPGTVYDFVCEPHSSVMEGILVALPSVPV